VTDAPAARQGASRDARAHEMFWRADAPTLSVVVPVHNERESLAELVAAIDAATRQLGCTSEVIFIDDGSTDDTLDRLMALADDRPDLRVVSFRRNFGKSQALECGFQMTRGDFVLTIDADLQDDPADLPRMYETLTRDRLDIVSGWRRERQDGLLKVGSSKLFNNVVVRLLFGASFRDMNSGLKLYRGNVARDLHLYGGMHRFIPLIATEMGYRVTEVPVSHHERKYGTSKYRWTKMFTEIPDLLTVFFLSRYTRRPLHFFGRVGSALFGVGFICLAYLSILWAQGVAIGGRPLLSLGILLVLVGGQIVFTGLLADLIVNMSGNKRQTFPIKYCSDARLPPEDAADGPGRR
jgi:glycosyltransferase involved in cell wall biosynthesis